MNLQLQPIDGEYFLTGYFCITTILAIVVSLVGSLIMDKGDN
jgi:hypothetical protein